MRNLKLITTLHGQYEEACDTRCMSLDNDTGVLYVATQSQLVAVHPTEGKINGRICLSSLPDVNQSGVFVALQYIPEECSLCAATSTGDLVLWTVHSNELECVGSVESGISSMTWSPDQEILVLTTGAETFILMTREFDPILESALHSDQFGEAEYVEVGWGKKETQFHGSVGKQAAQDKQEEVKPALSWDDRCPRVTWRGDGQFFAISSIHPYTGARKVCVWTREGALHSTSENVDGIEQALSWKPSGSLITTSQRRPNKHDIAFFEKNGLRHGEFTLPFDVNQVKVREVLWNLDSTVLAVWCEDLQQSGDWKTYVQLWTVGNYHWYLKQSLHFEGPVNSITAMMWDIEQPYRLHIVCKNGEYYQYTWAWATAHSTGKNSDDQALLAVIDGAKVLMTPIRHMVVPPPMSSYQLQLPSAVNYILFALPPNSNDIAVVLVDGRVAVYKFTEGSSTEGVKVDAAGGSGFQRCCPLPSLQGIYSINGLPSPAEHPLAMSHFTWIASDVIIFSTVTMATEPFSTLHKAKLEDDKISVQSSSRLESCVMSMAFNPNLACVAIEITDGTVLKYIPEDDMVVPWETSSGDPLCLPFPCAQTAVCEVGGEITVLGLTERYRFFVNDIEVASGCTSFAVHDEFLLLTTSAHTCRCISRHTKVKDLPSLSDGKAHPFDESVRRVERGSRIVVAIPDDTRLVLQMPRGNLETIHPRALVLSAVRKHLDRLEFQEAFNIMRKHRINMNLIHDHSPQMFLQNVPHFIQQIEAANNINLFLTDLIEEDVTVTMYTAAYQRNLDNSTTVAGQQPKTGPSKVDVICDAIRQALINVNENKYLLSILTSYVRKSKPELEEALQLVKKLRDSKTATPHTNPEEVLRYLLFLVDVNEMYDIALGTYDFDLVLMVAEKSQKDPKEYIPFLNQLRRLETNYQRYTIDKHLKRYNRALTHIVNCGADHFSECLELVSEHRLHTTALQLYTPASPEYKAVADSYGDVLSDKRRHEEAAIMYVKAESWEEALKSFVADSNWQQAFCMTAVLQYTSEQEVALARKLADTLKHKHRHADAAVVLEQYAKDTEEAIVTLIEGGQWHESLRMMYKYHRTDFIETDLKSQLQENCEHLMADLEESTDKFNKYRQRLVVVRQEKEKARLELLEGGGPDGVQDSDLFSDASSATGESVQSTRSTSSSVYSKMSGRSVKNRRKLEHKKWRLKEGSEFEDFALTAELAKIIKLVDSMREEVQSLLRVLVQFHFDRRAEQLQRCYDSCLSLIDSSIPQIWLDEEESQEFQPVLGPNTTANTIALALQQQGRTVQSVTEKQEKLDPIIKIAPILRKEKHWKLYALET